MRGSERSEILVTMEVGEVNQSASIGTAPPPPPGMICDGEKAGGGIWGHQESLIPPWGGCFSRSWDQRPEGLKP